MNNHFRQYWKYLSRYLKPQWPWVLMLAALILGGIALQLINPQVIRFYLDTAQAGGPQRSLLLAAGAFLGFALLNQILSVVTTYVGENVSWRATNRLRADLALHVLRLDMPFHKRRTPGELIERIDGDVSQLANFFSQFLIRVLGNLLLVLGILILLYREDWRVGLGATVYALVTMAVLRAIQSRGEKLWAASREVEANLSGFLEERLAGTEDIRANGGEPYVLRKHALLTRPWLGTYRKAAVFSHFSFVLTYGLYALTYALGIGVGALLYLNGLATIGTAYLFLYYISKLESPLQGLRQQVDDLQRAGASVGRITEIFGYRSRLEETPVAGLPEGALDVAFDGVSFAYDDEGGKPEEEKGDSEVVTTPGVGSNGNHGNGAREHVLADISFALEPGKVLGLLGRTGSGKTTLTRLLFRLYDPAAGTVRLGGQDICQVSLHDLRKRVGMVTQEVQLFQATLRENLTLFNRSIPDGQILNVLRELGLWEWFRSLPEGLDSRLAANGAGLSAGQAQLLAFARVFLKDPGLVILDEASSRLDPATEGLLERAIDRLLEGRTGLIIAHRLGTVQRADQILILEDGCTVEWGEREQLAHDPGSRFYHLLQTGLEEVLA
jgi:ATP-binding cassette subfamily B protein/ATP-binding cassette subfamily C protein